MENEHTHDVRHLHAGLVARLRWIQRRRPVITFKAERAPTIYLREECDGKSGQWVNVRQINGSGEDPVLKVFINSDTETVPIPDVDLRDLPLEHLATVVDAAEDELFCGTAAELVATMREWSLETHERAVTKISRTLRRMFLPRVLRYVSEDAEESNP